MRKFRKAIPHMSSTRFFNEGESCWPGTSEPIIWKLETRRHYAPTADVAKNDRPWREKRNLALYRGAMTGIRRVEESWTETMTDFEKCFKFIRCQLVYLLANSTLVDAKVTKTFGFLPDMVDGVRIVSDRMSMSDQLAYKAIIMLEGNDVSSGLKWALLSNSVVLMQPPLFTSWALEELLEPWVHYVPLNDNLSNVEERVQWVIDHDGEAEQIARRATLWIHDLLLHPDAMEDEADILSEIVRRYEAHFVYDAFNH